MGVKIWEVIFAVNLDSVKIVASDVDEALKKARAILEKEKKNQDEYWISQVELIAEAED